MPSSAVIDFPVITATTASTARRRLGGTRLGRPLLLLLLLMALAGAQLTSAHAAPVGSGWSRAAGQHGAVHFVGQYKDARGRIAYCTDFERLAPDYAPKYDDGHTGGFARSDGTRLSTAENGALSYLLHRWGATADDAVAASVQLAVWALTSPGMAWDSAGMNKVLAAERLPSAVVAEARAMTETAFQNVGPYQVLIDLVPDEGKEHLTAAITVQGGGGGPAAALAASAELSGPFALADPESADWSSTVDPHELRVERTGLGSGSIKVTVARTPAAAVEWLVPSSNDAQRLLIASVLKPEDAAAAIADLPAFQPTVETRTSATRTSVGSAVHDVLTVTAEPPATGLDPEVPWLTVPGTGTPVSVEVVSTLWGPLAAAPTLLETVPANTPAVGSVATRVNGPGTYTTDSLTVPEAGWYVWTETIAPESAVPAEASAYVKPWHSRFGLPQETTFVPWTPDINTQLSAHESLVGEHVTDSVNAEGFGPQAEGATGSVQLTMYGPLPERPELQPEVPAGAPLHSETSVPAVNGNHVSEQFGTFTESGCYTVVATFEGDTHTNPFSSPFGEPSETVCVSAPTPSAVPEPQAATEPQLRQDVSIGASPPHRPELARTGLEAGAAAGASLMLVGFGLTCLRHAQRRHREDGS